MISDLFKLIYDDCYKAYNKNRFSFLKNKKILITGSSGLIGQYFIGFFLHSLNSQNKPKKIVLISRSGLPKHLNFIKKNKCFEYRKIDLSKSKDLKIKNFDFIVHAATYAQPQKFTKNAIETINLNTTTTNELLKKIKKKGKFLFISSSEVYSGLSKSKLTELDIGNTNPLHPRSCYIESKRCGEAIVNAYRNKNYDAKSVRLCLAYGPGVKKDDNRVINEFIKKGLIQKKIEISGGEKNIRSYLYMSDAIKMLVDIFFFGKESVYNVGGMKKISIRQLASYIAKELNVPYLSKINKKNIQGAPKNVQIDIGKYKKEFKKSSFVDLKDGIKKTIIWYKNLLKINGRKI